METAAQTGDMMTDLELEFLPGAMTLRCTGEEMLSPMDRIDLVCPPVSSIVALEASYVPQ